MLEPKSVTYDYTGETHLQHDIKISLHLCSFRPEQFKRCLEHLHAYCSNPNMIEILVKIDTENDHLQQYTDILKDSPFEHKILCSPKLNEYWSIYIFLNNLTKLARGDVYWYICDDLVLKTRNWDQTLLETRNVFSDNIYLFGWRGPDGNPKMTGIPAVSKEWFQVLGFLSPFCEVDAFLVKLALRLQRFHTSSPFRLRINKESWRLHDRTALKHGKWRLAKKHIERYILKIEHLFLAQMTDPKLAPIPSWPKRGGRWDF